MQFFFALSVSAAAGAGNCLAVAALLQHTPIAPAHRADCALSNALLFVCRSFLVEELPHKDVDLGELFSRHRDTIETASVPTQLGLVDSELANDNILECDSEEEQLPSSLDEEQLSCDLDDGDESDNVLGFDDESDDALLYTDH